MEAKEIVEGLVAIRETCMNYGVEDVYISGIVVRRCREKIEEKRQLANSLLRDLCEGEWASNTTFIENGNILYTDLYTDGLHLVESGSVKLANNFLEILNNN